MAETMIETLHPKSPVAVTVVPLLGAEAPIVSASAL